LVRNFAVENNMTDKLDDRAHNRLFRTARTRNAWTEQPVTEQELRELYDLMKFGPTSGNCCPARFVWVRSAEGKSRLAAVAAPNNAPKILAAPLTVIVGYDLDFAQQLPKLFPARGKDIQAYYSDPLVAQSTAFSQQQPSGRLSDYRGARTGSGLRSNVWLQQRGGGFRILCQYTHQIQFHLLHRVRIE
jgi:nitroreductase